MPITPHSHRVVVTGSLAFDNIMDFPGLFKDHILADKAHVINISFLVEKLSRQRGGCAANIGYTLALLGEHPRLVATAGGDFGEYAAWLGRHGIDTSQVEVYEDQMTACCFITSDRAHCQITGFYPGAMARAREISLGERAGDETRLVVISPDDPEAMIRHCYEARQYGLPFLFDPSFQVTAMDGDTLAGAAAGAQALVVNDYEFTVFKEKTAKSAAEIQAEHDMVIVTYGAQGSEVLLRDGGAVKVPAARVSEVVDPTGAGDAFRGGFVAGLMQGLPIEVCGRMGSVAAVFAIERYGTQNHSYTREAFAERYRESFGSAPF